MGKRQRRQQGMVGLSSPGNSEIRKRRRKSLPGLNVLVSKLVSKPASEFGNASEFPNFQIASSLLETT
jgi:hypothetical protein